jgi:multiple sugar transport system permease protein
MTSGTADSLPGDPRAGSEGQSARRGGPRWRRRHKSVKKQRQRLAYILLAPLALFIGVLTLYPTAVTTVQAFFRVNSLVPNQSFIGLQNFRDAFNSPAIRESMVNTIFYVVLGTLLSTFLGLVFALLLRHRSRWRAPLLAIVILPWALPPVIEALFWSRIYDPSFGSLNWILRELHLIATNQVWIGSNRWLALALTELVQVWQMTPLSVLLILASLQLIPNELYEAAEVDGASVWYSLRYITLPLLRPGITVAMVAAITATLNIFDQPYILSGDATSTASVGVETYAVSFQNLNFGEGYALSLLVTIATAAASLVIMRLIYRRVEF